MPLQGEYEPGTSDWAREQLETYEGSGGTKGTTLRGMPVIILTSVGAKTGKLRKTPLMRVEHDGQYAVVASLGGAPKHPVWYYNLVANPRITIERGDETYSARAVLTEGASRQDAFDKMTVALPRFGDYQKNVDREIPMFRLVRE